MIDDTFRKNVETFWKKIDELWLQQMLTGDIVIKK